MKRILSACLLAVSLTACSSQMVSQAEYDAVVKENKELKKELAALKGNADVKDQSQPDYGFAFIDADSFALTLTEGIYQCGPDLDPGDYYIFSVYEDGANDGISRNPDKFPSDSHRLLRKLTLKKGDYVRVGDSGILVSADQVDESDWTMYGSFLVGEDIPAGKYLLKTKTYSYESLSDNFMADVSDIVGAYQISEGSPYADPEECDLLYDKQLYVELKEGQYITVNNINFHKQN